MMAGLTSVKAAVEADTVNEGARIECLNYVLRWRLGVRSST